MPWNLINTQPYPPSMAEDELKHLYEIRSAIDLQIKIILERTEIPSLDLANIITKSSIKPYKIQEE